MASCRAAIRLKPGNKSVRDDLLMREELSPLEGVFAPLDGLNKTSFFLEVARSNLAHQLVRIAALARCRIC
jgi:hypothetical protein